MDEVLNAECSFFDVELSYSQSQGDVFSSLVSIYKAMGGGWVTEADRLYRQRAGINTTAVTALSPFEGK